MAEQKIRCSVIFLLLLFSRTSRANSEAVYEFVKLFEYSDFSSSWPFTFLVSEGVSQAYWYFQASSSHPSTCEKKNVSIHLQHGSLPVINPLDEKFPDNFYIDGSQLRNLYVMTDNLTLSTNLRNPRSGHWYGVAYLPKTENHKLLPDDLFRECDYKLRSWFTTEQAPDIDAVSLGEKVDVVLAAEDSRLYKFFVPVNTKSHTVTVSNCAVVNTNTTSCPLSLLGKGQGIPGNKNSTNFINCSQSAVDDVCQLSDSSPALNDWTYLLLKSETENEMILTLEVKVTEIPVLPKPVTEQESQAQSDYQLLPLLDRFSYNSMYKNKFAYAVGGTVKDVVTTLTGSQTVILPFKLEHGDTGGSLAVEVKLKELLSTSMEIEYIVAEFCVLKTKLPFVESQKCQGGFLGNTTSQGQRSQKVILPYPSPETYFVGLKMKCFESPEKKNQSAIEVPCSTTSAKVSVNVTTDACVGGECNGHGRCHNYLNGQVLFSTCKCSAGDDVCDSCLRGQVVSPCRGCSGNAWNDVMEIDGEFFSLGRPVNYSAGVYYSVVCSQLNNGTEYEKLKKRLKEIIRKEKKRHKSIWPCLNFEPPAHLFNLKTIIVNIHLCHQHLQPYMEKMHKKFARNKKSATEIFSWLQSEFRNIKDQIEFRFWFLMNHILYWAVVNLKGMNEDQLEGMFGKSCVRKFTKQCRCI